MIVPTSGRIFLAAMLAMLLAGPARVGGGVAGVTTPGTVGYPDGGLNIVGTSSGVTEESTYCVVFDSANGHAYYGGPGSIIKVTLGAGDSPPVRIGATRLPESVGSPLSGVIDETAGYAYFGTMNSVLKVRLTPGYELPEVEAILGISPSQGQLRCAVIDAAQGFACFATDTYPSRIVKVALGSAADPPTLIGVLTLNAGEDDSLCVAHFPEQNCALFGTEGSPGRIVKVDLGAGGALPTRIGALTLASGEGIPRCAVVEPESDHALFGAVYFTGKIIKVAVGNPLSAPLRVSALAIPPNLGGGLDCAIYDWKSGQALFTEEAGILPGFIWKVAFGDGATTPSLTSSSPPADYSDSTTYWRQGFSDPTTGYACFSYQRDGSNSTSAIRKCDPGFADVPPEWVAATSLADSEHAFHVCLADPIHGHVYAGSGYAQGRLAKFSTGLVNAPPARIADIALGEYDVDSLTDGGLDPLGGYGYFVTNSAYLKKVSLGADSTPPAPVATVHLVPNPYDYDFDFVGFDFTNKYAYISDDRKLHKYSLGDESAPPFLVGTIELDSSVDFDEGGVIDPIHGFACIAAKAKLSPPTPRRILKFALGAGSTLPSLVSSLDLGNYGVGQGVIDAPNGIAYFDGETSIPPNPSLLLKIDLGAGVAAPSIIGVCEIDPDGNAEGADFLLQGAIDVSAGAAIYCTNRSRMAKVSLGEGLAPPILIFMGYLDSISDGRSLDCVTIDPSSGQAFFGGGGLGGDEYLAHLTKISYSQMNYVKSTRFSMPEKGAVTSASFYSHAAQGNVRLAVYSHAAPRNLLWESPPIPNTAANDWLIVPVGAGTPPALTLPAGDYWLAWQVDTNADVPSYSPGVAGDGMFIRQEFGPAPGQIDPLSPTSTTEKWSAHVTYDLPENNAIFPSDTIPATMAPGHGIYVGVSARNTGNTQWIVGDYQLTTILDTCNLMAVPSVALDSIVNPNQTRQHVFFITAPGAPESCDLQLQMEEAAPGPGVFGEIFSATIEIADPPNSTADWAVYE